MSQRTFKVINYRLGMFRKAVLKCLLSFLGDLACVLPEKYTWMLKFNIS